jgi:hypothetical protein
VSKVNISLKGVFTVPANVLVTVRSVLVASQNVVIGTLGALPEEGSKRTDSSGRVPGGFDLLTGRYQIFAKSPSSGLAYQPVIDVPDDNNEYEHTQLLVSGAAPFSQPLPVQANATANVFGIVRLTSKGHGIPETFDTISEAIACASSRLAIAKRVTILGSAAAFDGGGGEYFFVVGNAEVHDGISVLRPTDFGAAGINQGTLKKYL